MRKRFYLIGLVFILSISIKVSHAQTRTLRLTYNANFPQLLSSLPSGSFTPLFNRDNLVIFITGKSRPSGSSVGDTSVNTCHNPYVYWNSPEYLRYMTPRIDLPNIWTVDLQLDEYFGYPDVYLGSCNTPLDPNDFIYQLNIQIRTCDGVHSSEFIKINYVDTNAPEVRMKNSSGNEVLWGGGLQVEFLSDSAGSDLKVDQDVVWEDLAFSQFLIIKT